ncbi:MAG TPA: GNAT family N-acetyltransferase [Symbiobacteriaceae bacterium]|jgi:GNAT superfamily N-acetyltransferase|nr:GNAT family N-acetyltransferase [Symbiobacteriaceae bacterium]
MQDALKKIWATEMTWSEGAWKTPGSLVISRPDWYQVTTPDRPSVVYNGIYRSVMADGEADRLIDEVFEHYRAAGLPFRWTLGPSARPLDLADRLQRRGMAVFAKTVGMVIATDAPMPERRPGVTVEPVTHANLKDWAMAAAGGWGMPPEIQEGYAADMAAQMDALDDDLELVLARIDGEPAGAGMWQYVQGIGWLKGTAVRPEFRRQGAYQAMVAYRLDAMRQRGVTLAAIQATIGTSEPICRALGFEEVCQIDIYCSPS